MIAVTIVCNGRPSRSCRTRTVTLIFTSRDYARLAHSYGLKQKFIARTTCSKSSMAMRVILIPEKRRPLS